MTNGGLPPNPIVPPDVTSLGMPAQSAAVVATGTLIDYVPVNLYAAIAMSKGSRMAFLDPPIIGAIVNGVETTGPFDCEASPGSLIATMMFGTTGAIVQGTTLQIESVWQLVAQDLVQAGEPAPTMTESVTFGVSTTDTSTLSMTVGATAGLSGDGGSLGLSASLTDSFSQAITISQQTTEGQTFTFNTMPSEQVVAVYQLVQTFTLTPGANLLSYISAANNSDPPPPTTMQLLPPFVYSANEFNPMSGIDTADADTPRQFMTIAEAQALKVVSIT